MIRNFIILICFSLLANCSTLSDVQKAEGQGKKISYQAPFNKTWDASLAALQNLRLNVDTKDKTQGFILAEGPLTAFSWGEVVSLFIRKQTESASTVEAVSKRKATGNIFAKEWADEIHLEIAKELKK
jgi:uncharacterized lipoprotein